MMTHAYSEYYLSDAKDSLSQFFDYLINDCNMEADWVASIFVISGYAEQFERGNTSILEVSMSVGFHNLSYFHRAFKKKYHMTPLSFIKRLEE